MAPRARLDRFDFNVTDKMLGPACRWRGGTRAWTCSCSSCSRNFDGDAGVTSPSGATKRTGIEWANTWRINEWFATDWNAAFTRARFDQAAGPDDLGCGLAAPSHPCAQPIAIYGRYIPNSPTNVIDAGVTAGRDTGWYATLRARHFGESPLVEDNSARSPAYTTLDAQIGFRSGRHWQAALDVFDLGMRPGMTSSITTCRDCAPRQCQWLTTSPTRGCRAHCARVCRISSDMARIGQVEHKVDSQEGAAGVMGSGKGFNALTDVPEKAGDELTSDGDADFVLPQVSGAGTTLIPRP